MEKLREELLKQRVIHADETVVQVLNEAGRKAQSQSYLWAYRSSNQSDKPVVLFDYQQTRSGNHVKSFLDYPTCNPYTGFLQVDGYAGYNGLSQTKRVGCMAHVRRKFMDVIKNLPAPTQSSHAHQAVDIIGRLYEIEKRIKESDQKYRYKTRQEESKPILEEFRCWLDCLADKVLPKSALGKAVRYALDQWKAISCYIDDGELAIDNNIIEREIKQVVIGRKNWLFADSPEGMMANAVMYSLVQTAKANKLDPFTYLVHLFRQLPKLKKADEIGSLLPWNMSKSL